MTKQELIKDIEILEGKSKNLEGSTGSRLGSEYRSFENEYTEFNRGIGRITKKGHRVWLSQLKKEQLEKTLMFLVGMAIKYKF